MDSFAPQGSDGWLAARVGVLTASRYADVLAAPSTMAYKGYLLQIATERLTGISQESGFINDDMRRGTEVEPFAKAAYEAHTGDLIESCGLIAHPSYEFAGASPDGLLGPDGVLEVKCARSTTHVEYLRDKKLPAKYRAQVSGQLWVTGRAWAHFVSYDPSMPPHLQLLIVDVKRDDSYIEKLETAVIAFNAEVESLLAELQLPTAA